MADNTAVVLATDLDILVKAGFPLYLSRHALKVTRGDRAAAAKLLGKMNDLMTPESQIDAKSIAWRSEADDDWISYVPTSHLPTGAQSRGLWKSPVYCSVNGMTKNANNETLYHINIKIIELSTTVYLVSS
jgi:hypothetical protein